MWTNWNELWDTNPFSYLRGFQEDFNEFFNRRLWKQNREVFPPVNLWSNEKGVLVTAEAPGVSPEDIKISFKDELLTIFGTRRGEEGVAAECFHRQERLSGEFNRQVRILVRIDEEGIEANCKNGVLTVVLPRAREAQPKEIKVKIS